VKIAKNAYEKVTIYKGRRRNHLLSQITGFRNGVQDPPVAISRETGRPRNDVLIGPFETKDEAIKDARETLGIVNEEKG
jgi:hypothetical protein